MILLDRLVTMLSNEPDKVYSTGLYFPPKSELRPANFKKKILDHIENVNVFVIDLKTIFSKLPPRDLTEEDYHKMSDEQVLIRSREAKLKNEIDLEVAPPFETCWIQFPEHRSEGRVGFDSIMGSHRKQVYGVFIHETGPHQYMFALVTSDPSDNDMMRVVAGMASPKVNHEVWHTIATFLQPFNREFTAGVAKTSDRLKYRNSAGDKVLHKIKKVVYILPKKATDEQKSEIEKSVSSIEWSHRWQVRGHWRKITGIGKNRAGEYIVQGHTYVTEYEKGPEDVPLVKKTRVLEGDKNEPKITG